MDFCPVIMALVLDNRTDCAPKVQEILTRHGCIIKTRLGIHESCDSRGLILLNLCGGDEQISALEKDLQSVPGVRSKWMKLDI